MTMITLRACNCFMQGEKVVYKIKGCKFYLWGHTFYCHRRVSQDLFVRNDYIITEASTGMGVFPCGINRWDGLKRFELLALGDRVTRGIELASKLTKEQKENAIEVHIPVCSNPFIR